MLAVIFGVERFQTYVYGRSFTTESGHKPLESISQKNLADMPAHLQCMLLCLQGYNYTIHYDPDKEMALPDTLFWFSPCPGLNILLNITIHHACMSPERKEAFQQAFVSDHKMHTLANMIIMTSRWFLAHYAHSGNIGRPSLLKMALLYMEKPSLSLHQKGRGYYSNSTSSIKEPPKASCSCVDVSSGLALTKP